MRRVDADGLAVCTFTAEGLPCPVMEGLATGIELDTRDGVPKAPAAADVAWPPEPSAEDLIPWEASGRFPSAVSALWATCVSAVTAPFQFMQGVPWSKGDWRTPLIFALVCTLIGELALTFRASLAGQAVWASPTLVLLDHLTGFTETRSPLLLLPLVPVAALLEMGIAAALTHLGLGLYGGPRRSAEATFRVFAYGRVTHLLLVIPLVGHLIGAFLDVILLVGGLRLAHNAVFGRALFALALPFLLQGTLLIWSGLV